MLKLVIVDDEELEREGLKRNMKWDGVGIEVVGVYENGLECYNAIVKDVPDIILTDIEMPFMDGLTLAEKIKVVAPAVKFIFLTAHEEFKYAKRAVEINGAHYVLKPYDMVEFLSILTRMVKDIQQEKKADSEHKYLQAKLKLSLPLLKEKFCADLLNGIYRTVRQEVVIDRIKLFEIPLLPDGEYFVNIISIENFDSLDNNADERMKYMRKLKMQEFMEFNISGMNGVCVNVYEAVFAVILSYERAAENGAENYAFMEKLKTELQETYGADIIVGIGNPCGISDVYIAYSQAQEAANYKFTFGLNQIVCYSDVVMNETTQMDIYFETLSKDILTLIEQGKEAEIENRIGLMFHFLSTNNATKLYIQTVCIYLINSLSQHLQSGGIDIDTLFGRDASVIGKLLKYDTIFDTHMWMRNITVLICRHLKQQKNTRNQKYVEQIRAVVDRRFAEDITVTDIAQEVYLSAGYATMLFKKETGESIMRYIIKVRINRAKERLSDPTSRISEVSQSIGYSNLAYFTTLFRNEVGISPREYRDRFAKSIDIDEEVEPHGE